MSDPLSDRALDKLLAMAAEGEPAVGGEVPPVGDRYEIVRELGRGGMGIVYEAVDRRLGRRCALKMIRPVFGGGAELRERLSREALAAARLRHPHIAAVYDATPDYISMQLVAGSSIGAIPKSERRALVQLLRDAAHAVQHAHDHGIVHRDLKPSNLLVEGSHVFVVDFGLAKEISLDESRTLSGAVLGTPAFMAPEQARGRSSAIDARTDVYSLGATLYACLTGAPPFQGGELVGLLQRVIDEPAASPRIDRDLDLILLKCLEKDPAQRYATASALGDDLERWLRDEPIRARRPSLVYRVSKGLQRRKTLVRAALIAVAVTAAVLAPVLLTQRARAKGADEAVKLMDRAGVVMQDAAVFTRLGDHASAHQTLDAAISEARSFLDRYDVARVRYLLSRLLRARGKPDLAIAELDRAIAAEPGLVEARFERGLMSAARQTLTPPERESVAADLRSALGAPSALTSLDLLYGRGELERIEGRLDTATDLLTEVLAYDSTHVSARMALGFVALALRDAALARGDDDLARREDGLARHWSVSAVDLQQGLGPVYLARERKLLPTSILGLDGALVDFTAQLADGPDNALAFAHRGLVHLRRGLRLAAEGRGEDARAAVQSAIEDHDATLVIHADVPGALNNRAVCHMQAERLLAVAGDSAGAAESRRRAEADLSRALEKDPRLAEAHFNLGVFSLRSVELARKLGNAPGAARYADAATKAFTRARDAAPPSWPHQRACEAKLAEAEATSRNRR